MHHPTRLHRVTDATPTATRYYDASADRAARLHREELDADWAAREAEAARILGSWVDVDVSSF